MFNYRCLECGKQHSTPDAFARGYRAKCLRCSHEFEVEPEMAHLAPAESSAGREEAITTQAASRTAAPTADRTGIRQAPPAADTFGRTLMKKKTTPPSDESAGTDEDVDAGDASDATPEELESLERAALPPERKKEKKVTADDRPEKPAKVPAPKTGKNRWLMLSAIIAPVVLICGVGGYMVFGRSKPKQPVAKSAPAKAKAKSITPAPKKEEKKVDPAPPVKAKPPEIAFDLSAPRLAAEVASDPAKADLEYKDAWVEVSGLFDKLETTKPAKGTPITRALFLTEPGSVACDLSGALASEMAGWRSLKPGKPFNVQGVYGKGGVLTKCMLTGTRARADATFGGKTVELRGIVDAVLMPGPAVEFPTIELEVGTNSAVSVRCLFKKEDAPQVKIVKEGTAVTVKGVCAGRSIVGDKYFVRLDNCEFVSTTGPAPSVPRLAPIDLAREFEEDLRPYHCPLPTPVDPAEPALTVTQLSKEWKADGKALGRYRNRVVTVVGRLSKKSPGQLLLESPETDQPLTVSCRFGRAVRDRLKELPEYRVHGVCSGMEGARTLRLDDCGVDASQLQSEGPRLTADYLPHRPGTVSTYDFVGHAIAGKKSSMINRQVWLQRDNGVTETVITHTAKFSGESLFVPGKNENWTAAARTSKVRIPGPVYVRKETPVLIEFGQRVAQVKGGPNVETRLVIKVGVRAGESWEWSGENSKHTYTLVRFDTWRGKPSAVIKEVILRPAQGPETEVEHVYARDLGEVERREWLRITSIETHLIWESRMILGGQVPDKPPPSGGGKGK